MYKKTSYTNRHFRKALWKAYFSIPFALETHIHTYIHKTFVVFVRQYIRQCLRMQSLWNTRTERKPCLLYLTDQGKKRKKTLSLL